MTRKLIVIVAAVTIGMLFLGGPVQADLSHGPVAYYPLNGNVNDNGSYGQVDPISILSPSDNETIGYGSSSGKVTFSFSKITDAAKYILQLNLHDILTDLSVAVPVELIPPETSSGSTWGQSPSTGTTGFSEQFIGMVYDLTLDTATWDVLARYDIEWGVEAYDDAGNLIGSTYLGSTASKYVNGLKFIGSNAISMSSPANGAALYQTDGAPSFQWDTYQGTHTYTVILAHVGSLGFDNVLTQDNLTLNIFPMDDPAWQTMPTGTWYWTVLGYDSSGKQTPGDFTIFDFKVQSATNSYFYTDSDNGSTIYLTLGGTATILLDSNPTTGYGWGVKTLDKTVLDHTKNTYTSTCPDPDMAGCGGYETWTFEVAATGSTTLEMVYYQPWMSMDDAVDSFILNVVIQ